MKKVLFVVPSLEVGGTVSSLASLIQCLKDRYEISVFPIAFEGNLDVDFKDILLPRKVLLHAYNCNFIHTRGIIRIVSFLLKIIKRLTRFCHIDFEAKLYSLSASNFNDKYDVVVGFQEGCATKFVSVLTAPTKIAWIHCDYTKYPGCGKEFRIYNKYNKIVCVSKYTSDTFLPVYPSLSDRVTFVHNLMNYDKILTSSEMEIDDSRFLNDQFTILSVGRINIVKRYDKIPSIARYLADKGCKFRWYILGPNFADNAYKLLLDAITQESVQDFVVYLGNKINPYPYFRASDLLISLSSTEACPMIFNEAKVLELPVLTTDFGSSFEFINEGLDGYIVPLDKLGDKLYNILTNSDIYSSIQNGSESIMSINESIKNRLYDIFG